MVLFCGAPVEAPWADKVKGILYWALPGQAGGEAVKNLLYGAANPSGKLAETWPLKYSDCPSAAYYPRGSAQYREGIYVGYRYYDKAGVLSAGSLVSELNIPDFSYTDPRLTVKRSAYGNKHRRPGGG